MTKHYFFDSRHIEVEKDGEWIGVELVGFDDLSSRLHDRTHAIKVHGGYEDVHHKHFIDLYEKGRIR